MTPLALLFGPALILGLAAGALVYMRADPGGVWGQSMPAFLVGGGTGLGVLLMCAGALLVHWIWRGIG